MEQIAGRVTPAEPAAKHAGPATVEISSDGAEGSEIRPIALLAAEASGALGILVGVPVAELAEARSTPRATESVEASEEPPQTKSPSIPAFCCAIALPDRRSPPCRGADSRFRRVGSAASESGGRGGSLPGRGAKSRGAAFGGLRGRPPAAPRRRTARFCGPQRRTENPIHGSQVCCG